MFLVLEGKTRHQLRFSSTEVMMKAHFFPGWDREEVQALKGSHTLFLAFQLREI